MEFTNKRVGEGENETAAVAKYKIKEKGFRTINHPVLRRYRCHKITITRCGGGRWGGGVGEVGRRKACIAIDPMQYDDRMCHLKINELNRNNNVGYSRGVCSSVHITSKENVDNPISPAFGSPTFVTLQPWLTIVIRDDAETQ